MQVTTDDDGLILQVTLSQEFRAPGLLHPADESVINVRITPDDLQQAAAAWDLETAPFPDNPR